MPDCVSTSGRADALEGEPSHTFGDKSTERGKHTKGVLPSKGGGGGTSRHLKGYFNITEGRRVCRMCQDKTINQRGFESTERVSKRGASKIHLFLSRKMGALKFRWRQGQLNLHEVGKNGGELGTRE